MNLPWDLSSHGVLKWYGNEPMGAGDRSEVTGGTGTAGTAAGVATSLWSSDRRAWPESAGSTGGGATTLCSAERTVETEETADSEPELSTLEVEATCEWTGVLLRWR